MQGFEAYTYQVGVISPEFPVSRLNVCDEEPSAGALPAVEEVGAEVDCPAVMVPAAAVVPVAEAAEVTAENSSAAEVQATEVHSSDGEAGVEGFILQKRFPAIEVAPAEVVLE